VSIHGLDEFRLGPVGRREIVMQVALEPDDAAFDARKTAEQSDAVARELMQVDRVTAVCTENLIRV